MRERALTKNQPQTILPTTKPSQGHTYLDLVGLALEFAQNGDLNYGLLYKGSFERYYLRSHCGL